MRDTLIKRMASALYDYCVTRSHVYDYDRRKDLSIPGVNFRVRSCGGFRSWTLHAIDGRLCFSMDGYYHRSGRRTGSVMIHVGGGEVSFPIDNSQIHHNQRLTVRDGELVNVTLEESVEWDQRIAEMAGQLESATLEVSRLVKEYDERKLSEARTIRGLSVAMAAEVISAR